MSDEKKFSFRIRSRTISLDSRLSIFLFCLLISVFFWFLSSLSKQYATQVTVSIDYMELSESYVLTETPKTKIDIQVSGSGFDLLGEQMKLNANPIKIDLNRFISKDRSEHIVEPIYLSRKIKKSLDNKIKLENILGNSLSFRTNKREEKYVRVVPQLKLSFKPGFNQRDTVAVNPSIVRILGPSDRIDDINIIYAEEVTLEELSDTTTMTVDLNTKEYDEIIFDPYQVEVTVPVDKFTEKEFELPLTLVNLIDSVHLRLFPDRVRAIFLVPLNVYESFSEQLISAQVVYSEENSGGKKLSVAIKGTPDYAKLLRIEPERVEFILLN